MTAKAYAALFPPSVRSQVEPEKPALHWHALGGNALAADAATHAPWPLQTCRRGWLLLRQWAWLGSRSGSQYFHVSLLFFTHAQMTLRQMRWDEVGW